MERATILIDDGCDKLYLDLNDFSYAEVNRNYTHIYQTNGDVSVHIMPISKLMQLIDAVSSYNVSRIRRVGRSHIINTLYINSIELKRRRVTLQLKNQTKELECSRQALNELSRILQHQNTTDVLQRSRINYTVNADSYDDLCDELMVIDGIECVDLGLPSGVKWAIENLESPLDGKLEMFAWGETEPKSVCTDDNYRLGKETSLTKYTSKDGLMRLQTEDDAVTCILGEKWRTPSKEDFQELIEKCKWEWCTWGIHHGCLVQGPNGNSIFLHAGGYTSRQMGVNAESQGNYWTSSLYEDDESLAYRCSFGEGLVDEEVVSFFDEVAERYFGYYIRPVAD